MFCNEIINRKPLESGTMSGRCAPPEQKTRKRLFTLTLPEDVESQMGDPPVIRTKLSKLFDSKKATPEEAAAEEALPIKTASTPALQAAAPAAKEAAPADRLFAEICCGYWAKKPGSAFCERKPGMFPEKLRLVLRENSKKKMLVQAGECAKEGNATQELHVQAGKSAKEGTKELFAMAVEYVEQGSMKWTST